MFRVRHSSILWVSSPLLSSSVSSLSGQVIARRYITTNEEKLSGLRKELKKTASVTSLITQFDEQRQIETFGKVDDPKTESMTDGTRIHEILEASMASTHSTHELSLNAFANKVYGIDDETLLARLSQSDVPRLLECVNKLALLADNASTSNNEAAIRELYLRGKINGTVVRGVVDGLHISTRGIVITETKTTRKSEISGYSIRLAYHQALIYHKMMQSLLHADSPVGYLLRVFSNIDGLEPAIREYIKQPATEAISKLRGIGMSPIIYLEFMKRMRRNNYDVEVYELEYDSEVCDALIASRIDFINGKREAYDFQQSEIPQNVMVVDRIRPLESFLPAEISGLNLNTDEEI